MLQNLVWRGCMQYDLRVRGCQCMTLIDDEPMPIVQNLRLFIPLIDYFIWLYFHEDKT